MRVLLTNRALENRAGSELWVRDVALALVERGHAPVAYSPRLGAVASELRRATVPVIDDLSHLAERPDLIHGHHHFETMTALLHFPGVPAIVVCHGWAPHPEAPPAFPRIRRYVAVDDLVRERLVAECGIAPERLVMLHNFVDLYRFLPRAPLPVEPRRALALSNQASDETFVPALRRACVARGIQLEVAGVASGKVLERPEHALAMADVVFAKGRAALEAATMGCFVVLCDATGLGPAVLPGNLPRLRQLNFGARTLRDPIEPSGVEGRLAMYDPAGAAAVRDYLRATAGLDSAVDELIALYELVLEEERGLPQSDLGDELRAASRYLRWGPLRGSLWWDDGAARPAQRPRPQPREDYAPETGVLERRERSLDRGWLAAFERGLRRLRGGA